jgi:hypothetical protein
MSKLSKNALCPCGSGKKYIKCCATQRTPSIQNLPAGIRMKGGVIFDEDLKAYIPIVHTWDNVNCLGEPNEWRSEETFLKEEDALNYYKDNIRPSLQKLMSQIEKSSLKAEMTYKKLE